MKKELTKEIRVARNLTDEKVQLTEEGKKDYEVRLRHLVDEERPKVAYELKEARAQGDLSENADYDAAKNKQAEVEAEISEIEDILARVEIVKEVHTNQIRIGSHITYLRDNVENEVIIVGPVESDVDGEIAKIASNTPFAEALIGKKVTVIAKKAYKVNIIKVE
jgi:transcription elongation factor GreA